MIGRHNTFVMHGVLSRPGYGSSGPKSRHVRDRQAVIPSKSIVMLVRFQHRMLQAKLDTNASGVWYCCESRNSNLQFKSQFALGLGLGPITRNYHDVVARSQTAALLLRVRLTRYLTLSELFKVKDEARSAAANL